MGGILTVSTSLMNICNLRPTHKISLSDDPEDDGADASNTTRILGIIPFHMTQYSFVS